MRVVDDGCPVGRGGRAGARLDADVASGAAPASQDVAKLERGPDKLRVELADPEGVVIAERTLDGGASCAELGRMAAIVIASWESDVHPEFVRQPAEIVRVERAAGRPRGPPPPPPCPPRPTTSPPASRLARPTRSPPAPRSAAPGFRAAWVWDSGSSARATWRARSPSVRTRRAGGGGRRASSSRGAGRATRFVLDAHGGLTLGWLTTEGVDYTQNRSDSAVSLGGTAGIRTAWWVSRRAALWIDLRGFYFPRRDSIYGTAAGTTVDEAAVPSWGGIASVGVALGRAPLSR